MFGTRSHFSRHLIAWYDRHQRTLPWRVPQNAPKNSLPDPYHVLISEAMLQQTQVSTVLPYFHRFLARFPDIASLAAASEQDVLRLWQGLGYYSRARNLHATAKIIVSKFHGIIPQTVTELLSLPGIGRYTAGAISSLAFGLKAPILDGNVARVLCRLDCIQQDPRTPEVRDLLWTRAEQILPKNRVGDFNSALMELPPCSAPPARPNA